MTVLRPIADDALFYNSMTFFAQSLEGTADEIAEKVEEEYPDVEVEVHYGGQPIYYYVISVE